MLGGNGFGGGFMGGNKAARVADQVDAEAKAGQLALQNAAQVAAQFDFVESQLQQFAQIIGQADPMAAMQFQNLQQQINNIQGQVVNGIKAAETHFRAIDGLTDKIQG